MLRKIGHLIRDTSGKVGVCIAVCKKRKDRISKGIAVHHQTSRAAWIYRCDLRIKIALHFPDIGKDICLVVINLFFFSQCQRVEHLIEIPGKVHALFIAFLRIIRMLFVKSCHQCIPCQCRTFVVPVRVAFVIKHFIRTFQDFFQIDIIHIFFFQIRFDPVHVFIF